MMDSKIENGIQAKIIADSISPSGVRLTTLELQYHRFVHSEMMTHRMFSRNASSSRAIPVEKMLEQVQQSPAMPIHWGKNQPGMQAREELGELSKFNCGSIWYNAVDNAVNSAISLNREECHKQITNRILEPFQYIKVIVTATEWDNFFKLRLHKDAQPEIALLAKHMKEAMDGSVPEQLKHGEWHLPYIQVEDCTKTTTDNFVKLSVARCARVSYLNHDNSTPDIGKDIALYDKLLEAGHMSPLEHQLSPMESPKDNYNFEKGVTHIDRYGWKWSGNVRGWYQYRQLI